MKLFFITLLGRMVIFAVNQVIRHILLLHFVVGIVVRISISRSVTQILRALVRCILQVFGDGYLIGVLCVRECGVYREQRRIRFG